MEIGSYRIEMVELYKTVALRGIDGSYFTAETKDRADM
jgi:hypothetical protein